MPVEKKSTGKNKQTNKDPTCFMLRKPLESSLILFKYACIARGSEISFQNNPAISTSNDHFLGGKKKNILNILVFNIGYR